MTADQSAPLTPDPSPAVTEGDVRGQVLSREQRSTLLRTLDWGVESRNMTHETALNVLAISDRLPALLDALAAATERVRVVEGERDAAASEAVSWSIKAGRLSARANREQARAESAEAALAEAFEAGVRQAVEWLRADYEYGTGPDWRERGAEWISDRLAETTALLAKGAES